MNNEQRVDELNKKIEKRINEMENSDYQFPKRFVKKDYYVAALVVVVCIIAIFFGARL